MKMNAKAKQTTEKRNYEHVNIKAAEMGKFKKMPRRVKKTIYSK